MSRAARKKSSTGIYHIMLRGINGQTIFIDDEDNERFLQTLSECKAVSGFKLYGYCLMGTMSIFYWKKAKKTLHWSSNGSEQDMCSGTIGSTGAPDICFKIGIKAKLSSLTYILPKC